MAEFTYRNIVQRALTYAEVDDNFRRVEELHGDTLEARDVAVSDTILYPDTTAGVAATAEGGYFVVPDTATDELIYYRVESGAAVEKIRTHARLPFAGGTLTEALNHAPAVSLASAATVNIGAAAAERDHDYRHHDDHGIRHDRGRRSPGADVCRGPHAHAQRHQPDFAGSREYHHGSRRRGGNAVAGRWGLALYRLPAGGRQVSGAAHRSAQRSAHLGGGRRGQGSGRFPGCHPGVFCAKSCAGTDGKTGRGAARHRVRHERNGEIAAQRRGYYGVHRHVRDANRNPHRPGRRDSSGRGLYPAHRDGSIWHAAEPHPHRGARIREGLIVAISFVAATTKIQNSGTSIVIAKPAGVVEGDLMVAVLYIGSASQPNITPPSGWISKGDNAGESSSTKAEVFTKVAGPSEPANYAFTSSLTIGQGSGAIAAYRGTITEGDSVFTALQPSGPLVASSVTTADLTQSFWRDS